MADYPYTTVRASYPNDDRAGATIQVQEGGTLATQAVVDAVKELMAATPGVLSVTATRYEVAESIV